MTDKKRTISMLLEIHSGKRWWIYMKDRETCRRFYEDAEAEGLMQAIKDRTYDIFFVDTDQKITGIWGFNGHYAFYKGNMKMGIRVNYAKYIAGDDDFYIRSPEDLE